jgi:hypothetical protein
MELRVSMSCHDGVSEKGGIGVHVNHETRSNWQMVMILMLSILQRRQCI